MSKALEVEISAFLKQYDEAFTTFDGDKIIRSASESDSFTAASLWVADYHRPA
jgi:hypothetical protein